VRAVNSDGIDPGSELDLGTAGASARAEFLRRRGSDDRRRREMFGKHLAPLIRVIAGERQSTTAWERGGRGEEMVGAYLGQRVGAVGVLLHDRAIPGRRANIDHIAVVPSGVWVIDTKQYRGHVQRRERGRWFTSHPALVVNRRDRTDLITSALRQMALVERTVGAAAPLHAVLCFNGIERSWLSRPFTINGVSVTWARRLGRSLCQPGPLVPTAIIALAGRIATAFPSNDVTRTPPTAPARRRSAR
jgi:hypothetical protein